MKRRNTLASLALTLAWGICPGWSAAASTRMVVGYTAIPDFAAAFIAKEEGFFAKRGLDVELQAITLTSNVPAALVSNSIQIGGTTPPVFLQAAENGLDLVGVASGSTYDPKAKVIGIVTRTGSTIKAAQDLVGKKFAVPGLNGTLHVLVRRWLAMKGVDPKSVTFVEVPLPQIPDVLKAGHVDAAVTGEPFIGRIRTSGIGDVLPGFDSDMPAGFATVVYMTTRQWATANSAALQAFRAGIAEAIDFAQSNKAAAYADLGKYFKVPPPVLNATPWPALSKDMKDEHLRFWVETMRDQGMLRKQPMVSSLIAR
jgi:NitT/TauT family transport system substrate-binding protein